MPTTLLNSSWLSWQTTANMLRSVVRGTRGSVTIEPSTLSACLSTQGAVSIPGGPTTCKTSPHNAPYTVHFAAFSQTCLNEEQIDANYSDQVDDLLTNTAAQQLRDSLRASIPHRPRSLESALQEDLTNMGTTLHTHTNSFPGVLEDDFDIPMTAPVLSQSEPLPTDFDSYTPHPRVQFASIKRRQVKAPLSEPKPRSISLHPYPMPIDNGVSSHPVDMPSPPPSSPLPTRPLDAISVQASIINQSNKTPQNRRSVGRLLKLYAYIPTPQLEDAVAELFATYSPIPLAFPPLSQSDTATLPVLNQLFTATRLKEMNRREKVLAALSLLSSPTASAILITEIAKYKGEEFATECFQVKNLNESYNSSPFGKYYFTPPIREYSARLAAARAHRRKALTSVSRTDYDAPLNTISYQLGMEVKEEMTKGSGVDMNSSGVDDEDVKSPEERYTPIHADAVPIDAWTEIFQWSPSSTSVSNNFISNRNQDDLTSPNYNSYHLASHHVNDAPDVWQIAHVAEWSRLSHEISLSHEIQGVDGLSLAEHIQQLPSSPFTSRPPGMPFDSNDEECMAALGSLTDGVCSLACRYVREGKMGVPLEGLLMTFMQAMRPVALVFPHLLLKPFNKILSLVSTWSHPPALLMARIYELIALVHPYLKATSRPTTSPTDVDISHAYPDEFAEPMAALLLRLLRISRGHVPMPFIIDVLSSIRSSGCSNALVADAMLTALDCARSHKATVRHSKGGGNSTTYNLTKPHAQSDTVDDMTLDSDTTDNNGNVSTQAEALTTNDLSRVQNQQMIKLLLTSIFDEIEHYPLYRADQVLYLNLLIGCLRVIDSLPQLIHILGVANLHPQTVSMPPYFFARPLPPSNLQSHALVSMLSSQNSNPPPPNSMIASLQRRLVRLAAAFAVRATAADPHLATSLSSGDWSIIQKGISVSSLPSSSTNSSIIIATGIRRLEAILRSVYSVPNDPNNVTDTSSDPTYSNLSSSPLTSPSLPPTMHETILIMHCRNRDLLGALRHYSMLRSRGISPSLRALGQLALLAGRSGESALMWEVLYLVLLPNTSTLPSELGIGNADVIIPAAMKQVLNQWQQSMNKSRTAAHIDSSDALTLPIRNSPRALLILVKACISTARHQDLQGALSIITAVDNAKSFILSTRRTIALTTAKQLIDKSVVDLHTATLLLPHQHNATERLPLIPSLDPETAPNSPSHALPLVTVPPTLHTNPIIDLNPLSLPPRGYRLLAKAFMSLHDIDSVGGLLRHLSELGRANVMLSNEAMTIDALLEGPFWYEAQVLQRNGDILVSRSQTELIQRGRALVAFLPSISSHLVAPHQAKSDVLINHPSTTTTTTISTSTNSSPMNTMGMSDHILRTCLYETLHGAVERVEDLVEAQRLVVYVQALLEDESFTPLTMHPTLGGEKTKKVVDETSSFMDLLEAVLFKTLDLGIQPEALKRTFVDVASFCIAEGDSSQDNASQGIGSTLRGAMLNAPNISELRDTLDGEDGSRKKTMRRWAKIVSKMCIDAVVHRRLEAKRKTMSDITDQKQDPTFQQVDEEADRQLAMILYRSHDVADKLTSNLTPPITSSLQQETMTVVGPSKAELEATLAHLTKTPTSRREPPCAVPIPFAVPSSVIQLIERNRSLKVVQHKTENGIDSDVSKTNSLEGNR